MKKTYSVLVLAALFCLAAPNFATAAAAHSKAIESVVASGDSDASLAAEVAGTVKADWEKLSAKEKRTKRKAIKQALKDAKANGSDGETILLVILAILLPPLAMALYDGITTRFWISLLLWLLFYLPGLIYTLVIILGKK